MTGELLLARPVSVSTSADLAPQVHTASVPPRPVAASLEKSGLLPLLPLLALTATSSLPPSYTSPLYTYTAEMASRTATRALRSSLRQAARRKPASHGAGLPQSAQDSDPKRHRGSGESGGYGTSARARSREDGLVPYVEYAEIIIVLVGLRECPIRTPFEPS